MDIVRWILIGVAVIAAVLAPFAIVMIVGFLHRHLIMPIYYFARYRDELEPRVRELQRDGRVLKYPGSVDHMNDLEDERGGIPSARLRDYIPRSEELERERVLDEKTKKIFKSKPK